MTFNTCPRCAYVFVICQVHGCDNYAEYMGWKQRSDDLATHMRVCKEHTVLLNGYDRFIDLERNDEEE